MGIYIIIFIVILGTSLLSIFVKINKYYSVLIFILLLLFGALRYKIGMDYESYEDIFNLFTGKALSLKGVSDLYLEPGYAIILSYLKYIGFGNIGIFAIHMALSLYFFHKAILRYSYNTFISWNIFYGVYYANLLFNGMRQGLFIAIILYVFPRLLKKTWLSFFKVLLLSFLLAFFLHKTALALPIIYLVCLFKPTIKYKYAILFGSLVWAFTGLGNVLVQVGGLSFFKDTAYLGVVDFYSQNESFGSEIKLLSISVLHRLVILFLALYFSEFKTAPPVFKKLTNIYFWGAVIYFVLTPLGYMLATRVSMNVKAFDLLLIPYFVIFLKEYKFKFLGLMLISAWSFAVMLTNFYIPGNYPYYIPYRTILSR
ncbi:EpsG family protein [Pedobacter fastidiosus]|uniref:EpsG family protein n=1 Tax=Pedobacter fastidiosus TaxID=2765361 RepID=A0ABR7KR24_9SPHI|nr:EpsG family protein [Pedobacter fastidiosus]MBC6110546.1 EpsG family protein [Pedobacter fastidiosus]